MGKAAVWTKRSGAKYGGEFLCLAKIARLLHAPTPCFFSHWTLAALRSMCLWGRSLCSWGNPGDWLSAFLLKVCPAGETIPSSRGDLDVRVLFITASPELLTFQLLYTFVEKFFWYSFRTLVDLYFWENLRNGKSMQSTEAATTIIGLGDWQLWSLSSIICSSLSSPSVITSTRLI